MSDCESGDSLGEISRPNASLSATRQKLLQRYRPEYSMQYPVVHKLSVDDMHAYCCLCNMDFSVGHSGLLDVKRYVGTAKHEAKAHASTSIHYQEYSKRGNPEYLKYSKIVWWPVLCPRPYWGSLQCSPDQIADEEGVAGLLPKIPSPTSAL